MTVASEFKAFAMKGNVVDLAVGVIVGVAFGKVITSMVNDVLMPPIGKLMGGVNFSDLFISLDASKGVFTSLKAAKDAGVAVIAYGSFINTVIDFTIVAFAIFLVIRALNKLKQKQEAAPPPAPPAPSAEEKLLSEIRDLLKSR